MLDTEQIEEVHGGYMETQVLVQADPVSELEKKLSSECPDGGVSDIGNKLGSEPDSVSDIEENIVDLFENNFCRPGSCRLSELIGTKLLCDNNRSRVTAIWVNLITSSEMGVEEVENLELVYKEKCVTNEISSDLVQLSPQRFQTGTNILAALKDWEYSPNIYVIDSNRSVSIEEKIDGLTMYEKFGRISFPSLYLLGLTYTHKNEPNAVNVKLIEGPVRETFNLDRGDLNSLWKQLEERKLVLIKKDMGENVVMFTKDAPRRFGAEALTLYAKYINSSDKNVKNRISEELSALQNGPNYYTGTNFGDASHPCLITAEYNKLFSNCVKKWGETLVDMRNFGSEIMNNICRIERCCSLDVLAFGNGSAKEFNGQNKLLALTTYLGDETTYRALRIESKNLIKRCINRFASSSPRCFVFKHGDPYLGNIILKEGDVYFIDFDKAGGLGNPLFDPTNFLNCLSVHTNQSAETVYGLAEMIALTAGHIKGRGTSEGSGERLVVSPKEWEFFLAYDGLISLCSNLQSLGAFKTPLEKLPYAKRENIIHKAKGNANIFLKHSKDGWLGDPKLDEYYRGSCERIIKEFSADKYNIRYNV